MKIKKTLKETDNNSVYKKAFIDSIDGNCHICSPNKGCNKRRKRVKNSSRNWKEFRNSQWK